MRGCDGKLCFIEKGRGKVCKDYMKRIMNEENDWDYKVEGGATGIKLNEDNKSPWSLFLLAGE